MYREYSNRFSKFGLTKQISSDAPAFTSDEFKTFLEHSRITHFHFI